MSVYTQLNGILGARNEMDDQYWSKRLFRFSPLQGKQDGNNTFFQIPQTRIVVYSDGTVNIFPQMYKNNAPLIFGTDYTLDDPISGDVSFTVAPLPSDSLNVSLNWTWFTDAEWDYHLTRAANLIGFATYWCTGTNTVVGTLALPANGSAPSSIPDGLYVAIIKLATALACRALSLRFATRYDTSAGQQSFSPSQMSKQYGELADALEKQAYADRDDYYKGQGKQYQPSVYLHGFVLPNFTPER